MKFQGVEFSKFACFERQFVRIGLGINLLVGKNNSGKTAILRGLASLDAVPHGPVNALATSYIRETAGDPVSDVNVLLEVEPNDPGVFADLDRVRWGDFVRNHSPLLRFRFQIWKRTNLLYFCDAQLLIAEWPPLEMINSDELGVRAHTYYKPSDPAFPPADLFQSRLLLISGKLLNTPGGTRFEVPATTPGFGPVLFLKNTRLISPHRVVPESMQTETTSGLRATADNLPVFLSALHYNDREKFKEVAQFVTDVFPEFESIEPEGLRNQVAIRLKLRGAPTEIALSCCGTGVEQMLALATFIVTSKPGSLVLLDEPHSFLHPSAERRLLDLLRSQQDKYFVLATHSSLLVNAVEPERITYLGAQDEDCRARSTISVGDVGRILFDLGYRNSDALFFDRLIIVEGTSDKTILPLLLAASGQIPLRELGSTGFPFMEGVPDDSLKQQTAILKFEQLLRAVGRQAQPRIYMFDGDRSNEEISLLVRTRSAERDVIVVFLPRLELENYLLAPAAITLAINEEAELAGQAVMASEQKVTAVLYELLDSDDVKLFPRGKRRAPEQDVKGSRVLERIYDKFGQLAYDKNKSGRLVAKHITLQLQPALTELVDLVASLFQPAAAGAVIQRR